MANNKEKKTVRKVCFQTSTDSSVEEEAMKTFLVFESGDSGDLSFNEFQQAVDEMGMDLEAKKVQNLFRQVDTDGNGKVDFEEFLKLMKHKQKKTATKESEDPNMQIFKMFDKDGSGSLSSQEWLEVMNLMGLKTTKEEAAQLFSSVDKNGDGRIGLQEFISYIGN